MQFSSRDDEKTDAPALAPPRLGESTANRGRIGSGALSDRIRGGSVECRGWQRPQ